MSEPTETKAAPKRCPWCAEPMQPPGDGNPGCARSYVGSVCGRRNQMRDALAIAHIEWLQRSLPAPECGQRAADFATAAVNAYEEALSGQA